MTTITTDFAAGNTTAVVNTKLSTIAQYWGGTSALTGATTYGAVRTVLNGFANSANQIADQELGSSFITKLNWLNNIESVVTGQLFAASEPGVWYDPSDLTTLFQDNLVDTPVTAPGQTVGLMLDKSQGLVLGSELFSSLTGGSAAGSSAITGAFTYSYSGSGTGVVGIDVGAVAGQTYLITLNISSPATTNRIYITSTLNGAAPTNAYAFTSGSTVTIRLIANGSFLNLQQTGGGSAGTATINQLSVKLLAGNHATQATLAQRPTYGINPITGTRNLLTRTEEFDNAAWAKSQTTVSANTAVAPDGTTTADSILDTAVANIHYCVQDITSLTPSGKTYTVSAYAKANTLNYMTLGISDISSGSLYAVAVFNLSTGVVSTSGAAGTGYSVVSSSISSVGSGWYRCIVTVVAGTSVSFLRTAVGANKTGIISAGTGGMQSYLGDGSGFYVWGAQLELGSTATAYQKVVSQYEVTEAGVASVSYLAFDGVDDGMVTGTITPAIDKVQVFAGVRKLSNSVAGVIAELSSSFASNNGSVQLTADGGNLPTYLFGSKGTTGAAATATPYVSPITNVVTGLGDIAGDNSTIRVNGIQAATSATDQGTGNYLAYPLYIGRRGGTSLPYNGRIYSLITRFGANLTAGQISQFENFTNSKAGAY